LEATELGRRIVAASAADYQIRWAGESGQNREYMVRSQYPTQKKNWQTYKNIRKKIVLEK